MTAFVSFVCGFVIGTDSRCSSVRPAWLRRFIEAMGNLLVAKTCLACRLPQGRRFLDVGKFVLRLETISSRGSPVLPRVVLAGTTPHGSSWMTTHRSPNSCVARCAPQDLTWPGCVLSWLTFEATMPSNRLEARPLAAELGEIPPPLAVLGAARFEESIADQCAVGFHAAGHVVVATDGSSRPEVVAYSLGFPLASWLHREHWNARGGSSSRAWRCPPRPWRVSRRPPAESMFSRLKGVPKLLSKSCVFRCWLGRNVAAGRCHWKCRRLPRDKGRPFAVSFGTLGPFPAAFWRLAFVLALVLVSAAGRSAIPGRWRAPDAPRGPASGLSMPCGTCCIFAGRKLKGPDCPLN